MDLFKACYQSGQKSLKHINTIAVRFLSGSGGCQKDLEYGIELLAYVAQGDKDARINLQVLANHFLSEKKLEAHYGIDEQDVLTGHRILDYLEKLKHFSGVWDTLNVNFPCASILAIICEYVPEIQPVFFQCKNPLLECVDFEKVQTSFASLVKLDL